MATSLRAGSCRRNSAEAAPTRLTACVVFEEIAKYDAGISVAFAANGTSLQAP